MKGGRVMPKPNELLFQSEADERGLTVQPPIQPVTPMGLLQLALEKEGNIEVIKELAKLQREEREYAAKVAYAEAIYEFKLNVPVIVKTASIVVNGQTRGKFAPLDEICEKLIPAMIEHGITHRWKTSTEDNGKTTVTCYLRHRKGYEEEGSSMTASPDTSGSKNAIQADGSTVSYLQRYTLVTSCGIAIKGQDSDGNKMAFDVDRLGYHLDLMRSMDSMEDLSDAYKNAFKEAKVDGIALKAVVDCNEQCKKELGRRK